MWNNFETEQRNPTTIRCMESKTQTQTSLNFDNYTYTYLYAAVYRHDQAIITQVESYSHIQNFSIFVMSTNTVNSGY